MMLVLGLFIISIAYAATSKAIVETCGLNCEYLAASLFGFAWIARHKRTRVNYSFKSRIIFFVSDIAVKINRSEIFLVIKRVLAKRRLAHAIGDQNVQVNICNYVI